MQLRRLANLRNIRQAPSISIIDRSKPRKSYCAVVIATPMLKPRGIITHVYHLFNISHNTHYPAMSNYLSNAAMLLATSLLPRL